MLEFIVGWVVGVFVNDIILVIIGVEFFFRDGGFVEVVGIMEIFVD